MEEEKFWRLLSLKLSGEATVEELETLEALLQQHPEMDAQAQLLIQMWKKNHNVQSNTQDFFNRHMQRLNNHEDTSALQAAFSADNNNPYEKSITITRNRFKWLLPLSGVAAAAIILLFVFNGALQKKDKPRDITQNTITTLKGTKSNIQLPDGTLAWLNADSKLVYNKDFSGSTREIILQGEAYFDVVKDKTRPFIIHTKTVDIKVLGTAFNVRAYETEKNTETSLFRGSVEVTLHNNPEKKIVLKPNEKLLVNNKEFSLTSAQKDEKTKSYAANAANITVGKVHFETKDSTALETLWIKNKLVFDEETLEEAAQKIERWYDVKVIINGDDNLKHTSYSAIFENETLAQVMEALKITGSFRYTINKNVVTIR